MAEGDVNPSYAGTWIDGAGRVWHRKGKRTRPLDLRRVRGLLRRPGVQLIVWESFETTAYVDPPAKEAAAAVAYASTADGTEVFAHEWTDDDGGLLLMLEIFC